MANFFNNFCFISVLASCLIHISIADDMLNQYQFINESSSLVSAGGKFKLGFFSPGNSKNRYVGIWYNNIPIQTIVWVANRDHPLNDSSGVVRIGDDGNLILLDYTEKVVWSTNIMNLSSKTTVAQLLDSGNLILKDGKTSYYHWQSFDYPSDTLLAGMKLGWDLNTGLNRYLTSRKSADDPSPGEFSWGVDLTSEIPQLFVRKGSVNRYRSDPYYFLQQRLTENGPDYTFNAQFVNTSEEVYYEFDLFDEMTSLVLNYTGVLQRYIWSNKSLHWIIAITYGNLSDPCNSYNQCGPNAICNINDARICGCFAGYTPNSLRDWNLPVWSGGCERKHPLNCPKGEGFVKVKGLKIPDLLQFQMNRSTTLEECERECLKNCSCTAYAFSDSTGPWSVCLLWYGDLVDIRKLSDTRHQDIYVRVTASDLGSKKKKWLVLSMIVVSVFLTMVLLVAFCILWKRRIHKKGTDQVSNEENLELPLFNIVTIAEATNNFSDSNKIGEGGFGPVYKGQLSTGQEIAVKRLSESSQQGLIEFKNEVMLIAKLQHRNLVRLLGCCVQGEERILIYEYMPTGSLDSLIFDDKRSNSLAWKKRFDIIVGIARGLLYLHRDSRLRIIHRDLKASNVLLDSELNPKISDFGIARAVGGDQLLGKTRRVVGTYGYMSPEYVIKGFYSMKSDVFSFGVLILEIVCGKRNTRFRHPNYDLNLIGHAWKLWSEGKASELIDEQMEEDSFPVLQVLRCIQIGLLCVQQRSKDRPTMSMVLSMLDSETSVLPQPKQAGFYTLGCPEEMEMPLGNSNRITFTNLEGR